MGYKLKRIMIRPNGVEKQVRPVWKPGANTIAYYKFDGNLNDSSGNNNNGTAGGTITYGANYANLTSGYITVPNLSYSTPMTISFWFKRTSTASWNIVDISSSSGMIMRLGYSTGSNYFYCSSDKPSWTGEKHLMDNSDTNRHLFQLVADTTGLYYYFDASLKGNSSAWNSSYTSNGTKIGAVRNGSQASNPGLYAGYFIIENKARTAQEIQDYYNLTKGNYGL